ncbi:CehA/McbA family metallohydrolase [Brachybacterium sp. UMB0905]|uniref:CehA/McbA family metallohydrolase n=1 Tax=Brachybacterium sp. UMB0905 TaxID=2069310 RepID=UPI0011AECA98|nr:CehA/McbA family metallohydrolase [Brachybacterium sp. UMB0905]
MSAPSPSGEAVHDVNLTLERQSRDRYVSVPFTVAPGTRSFEVRVSIKGSAGEDRAVVDLGCEGPAGWRGWSGGARTGFMIGEDTATPGYVPGPLESGPWSVILGIHALPGGPARARVRVLSPAVQHPDHGADVDAAPRTGRGSARQLPAPAGLRWYAADMHSHSLHSDGRCGLHELAREGVRSGLDLLFVTDHNTVSHHAHLGAVAERHGIGLLPGQEVTSHRGHANALGPMPAVDFRHSVEDWARQVRAAGGLLSVNHPVSGDCSWLETVPDEVGGVEILHADSYAQPSSTAAFAWLAQVDASRRHRGLAPLTLLGGGDFHSPEDPIRPGTPTTWICAADTSWPSILEALRAGRTTVTGSAMLVDGMLRPDLRTCPILLRVDDGKALHVLAGAGHVLVDREGGRRTITEDRCVMEAPRELGPYRLETAQRCTIAICR